MPMGKSVIGCKWIIKEKNIIPTTKTCGRRHTTRLMAKGFTHNKEVDYNEIFFSSGETMQSR